MTVVKEINSLGQVEWFHNQLLSGGRLLTQDEEASLDMSMALIFVHAVNERIVNHDSHADYYILGGGGYFHIGHDNETRTVIAQPGEVVHISQETPYWDVTVEGEGLLMLAINHPAYDASKVEVLDKPRK